MENNCNFKPFDKVLVRYDDQHVWQIDFFSHYVRGVECPYKCLTRDFNQCIPYNGNEHLIDTTSEPSLPTQSQTQTKENKMEEDCDNYGYPVEYFKKNDVVLCRDAEDGVWEINSFVAKGDLRYPFQCEFCGWKYCIPYEGNEGDFFEENCKDLEFAEKKPVEAEYNKCFYNYGTKNIYKTLSAARSACKSAYVYRCWALGDEVKYLSQIACYSEQVCTIKQADEKISKAIKNGTVGVGFKDKRMC